MTENLKKKLSELPHKSGVYLMYDAGGKIIYVGKAKVLAHRVRQYFQNSTSKTDKVIAMVENIDDLSYIITSSELDAFALESNLIKKHKPHYNILLKDDKSHPYIRIDFKQKYPAIEIVRRVRGDGAKYWGPFFGGVRAQELVEIIQSAFMIRACKGNTWRASQRACLNYHIGLCSGPCAGHETPEQYRARLMKVSAFLSGDDDGVREYLTEKMELAAQAEKFEQAIVCRDRLQSLDRIRKRLVMNVPRFSNFDVFGYATNNLDSVITALIVRAGKTIACEPFTVSDASFNAAECFSSFLTQYYDQGRGLPDEIIVGYEMPDADTLEEYLYGKYKKRAKVSAPKKGVKKKLVDTARVNAEDYLEKAKSAIERRRDMTEGAVIQLQEYLGLPSAPRRIECYDISNISGTDKVASMAVFTGGDADKSQYRRFKIKTVEGADDYACMAEVLKRRMTRLSDGDERFDTVPDLIVIDGGKGQLAAAQAAMSAAGFAFPMIALAEKEEDVFVPGKGEPLFVPKTSFALKMLQRVRDEAHRFALAYHRNLRSNRYTSSLEEIPGVGKQRRIKLLAHFRSVEAIKTASVDALRAAGLSEKVAETVFNHFH